MNEKIICFRCDCEITSVNQTVEHVIPMACGGRLKSKKLLCRGCNSLFGGQFDAELAERTNALVNLLMIKREKGSPPPTKAILEKTGEDYLIHYGGNPEKANPEFKLAREVNGIKLFAGASNEKKMKLLLRQLKKKIPNIDIDEILKNATHQKYYMNDHLTIQMIVGGKGVFKSLTKISIEYFLLKGGDKKYIKHLLPYLYGKHEMDVVWMHYPEEPIYQPETGEVSNIIRLIGNPQEKILYAYIELFSVHNFIVRLSDVYDGNVLDEAYIFDLLEIKQVVKSIPLNYKREQLLNFFINKDGEPHVKVKGKFERILSIALERQIENEKKELLNTAIRNALGKYPEATLITKEMQNEVLNEVIKEIMPFIVHQGNKVRATLKKNS